MNITDAIQLLDQCIPDPTQGLGDEFFRYINRVTPVVNVDLLIKDELGRTLLSWRNDGICEAGWHIPGGIIRYKETFRQRLEKVAETEIGIHLDFDKSPVAVNEIIMDQAERGHLISFLYRAVLPSSFAPLNAGLTEVDAGYLKWHASCPVNLLRCQKVYQKYIDR